MTNQDTIQKAPCSFDRENGIERQSIEIPCIDGCGGIMDGEARVATRPVAMEFHIAQAGEIIRFHWIECRDCGAMQVS